MLSVLFNELLVLFVLVLLSALFSLSETAIVAVSRIKIKHMVEQKVKGSRSLQRLREFPSRLLGAVLIGNNIVNIGASALATSIIIKYLTMIGLTGISYTVGISTGIMTFVILVFAEIIPKTVALRNPEKMALLTAPLIDLLASVLQPIIQFLSWISAPFIGVFGAKMPRQGPFLSREEIRMLLAVSEKEGELEEEERAMISSIFEFGSTVAREVVTPKPDLVCIEVNEGIKNAVNSMIESGHSRIPVYEGTIDNILGVIYAKELLKTANSGMENMSIRDFLRPVLMIPESKKVDELLHQMQAARMHIAITVDEYGTTTGLITLEDLMEEIIGEVHDEFEKEEKAFDQLEKNIWVVDARQRVSEVNKELRINIPEGQYDTLSGFVFSLLGKLPIVGDEVKYDDISISVERIHKRRITKVKIIKTPKIEKEVAVGG
jgi:CBS domain containing-hemolysin-like protein